jgi:hypothetical protein
LGTARGATLETTLGACGAGAVSFLFPIIFSESLKAIEPPELCLRYTQRAALLPLDVEMHPVVLSKKSAVVFRFTR